MLCRLYGIISGKKFSYYLKFCHECLLQLLEAAWCLTNIAAGNPEETKALLPALPLLIAHLGGQ